LDDDQKEAPVETIANPDSSRHEQMSETGEFFYKDRPTTLAKQN
jgi:hypothetical protein